jgi:hypothetical protein
MTMKPTGPLFKWFGSKWSASKHYPPPLHDFVIEPYAGSAGYSLRHSDRQVSLYEANPLLQKLWQWIIEEAEPRDVLQIPLGLAVKTDISALDLSEGQKLLLKHWQRTNNVGNCWTVSPWGHLPGQWTANTRARVAREIECVKHWKFEKPSYRKVATYFLDPPYQFNYDYRLPVEDYSALASLATKEIPKGSQILFCEAVCPLTGKVPSYLPFQAFRSQVTSRRKATQSHHSKELLYYVEKK